MTQAKIIQMSPLQPGPSLTEPVAPSPYLGVCLAQCRRIPLDGAAEDVPVVRPVTVLNTQKLGKTEK